LSPSGYALFDGMDGTKRFKLLYFSTGGVPKKLRLVGGIWNQEPDLIVREKSARSGELATVILSHTKN
jgi:hypothetical protein